MSQEAIIDSLDKIKQITEIKTNFRLELFKHIDDWVHLAFFGFIVVLLLTIVKYAIEQAETNQSKKDQEKEITHREIELTKLKIRQNIINQQLEGKSNVSLTDINQFINGVNGTATIDK